MLYWARWVVLCSAVRDALCFGSEERDGIEQGWQKGASEQSPAQNERGEASGTTAPQPGLLCSGLSGIPRLVVPGRLLRHLLAVAQVHGLRVGTLRVPPMISPVTINHHLISPSRGRRVSGKRAPPAAPAT